MGKIYVVDFFFFLNASSRCCFLCLDMCVASHGPEKGKDVKLLVESDALKSVYIAQNIYKNQKNN